MTTFYIIRHGETDWNVEKRIQGQTDIPLNENGKVQAKNLARELKNIKFDLAFSSDLLRAKQTAEIIALEHQLTLETTQLLRERVFGKLEGKPATALNTYNQLLDKLSQEEYYKRRIAEDVESNEELVTRLLRFIRETAITHPNKVILTVSHGGSMGALLLHLGYISLADWRQHKMNNSGYIKLITDGIEFHVEEVKGLEKKDW